MTNLVRNRGYSDGRLFSPKIWGDCPPPDSIREAGGTYHFDDFDAWQTFAEGDDVGDNDTYPYFTGGSDGVTIAKLADTDYGTLEVAGNDADNDGSLIVYGNAGGFARFGSGDRVWLEGEIAKASVADNALSFFLGFLEVNVVPTTIITLVDDTHILDASEDFVGWRTLAADGDAAEPIYQEGGQTLAHVGTGTTNAQGSGNDTVLVAATYYKFGLKWDGRTVKYYVDNTLAAYYTPTSANSFPDTNHLAACWATKVGAAAESKTQMKWWAFAALAAS